MRIESVDGMVVICFFKLCQVYLLKIRLMCLIIHARLFVASPGEKVSEKLTKPHHHRTDLFKGGPNSFNHGKDMKRNTLYLSVS